MSCVALTQLCRWPYNGLPASSQGNTGPSFSLLQPQHGENDRLRPKVTCQLAPPTVYVALGPIVSPSSVYSGSIFTRYRVGN